MDHWFDILTRNLNRQPLTRRTMISWTTRLGLVAGAGLLSRKAAVVEAAPATTATAAPLSASTCTVTDSYGVLTAVATTSVADLKLTHRFISEVGSGSAFSVMSVTPAAAGDEAATEDVVVQLTTSSVAGRHALAHTMLGRRFTGGERLRARFQTDGRTLEGHVDGRVTEPVPLGTDVKGLRFKDGQPARPLQTPAIQQSVSALLAQSRGQLGACSPDPKASTAVATCSRCQLTCRQSWVDCSVSAAQASLAAGTLAAAAYLNAASATCDAKLQTCLSTCKSAGACCPDFCKGDAACCQSAWGCCPPSGASTRPWSKTWPTCPRCGTPPWPAPAKPSAPRTTPVRR